MNTLLRYLEGQDLRLIAIGLAVMGFCYLIIPRKSKFTFSLALLPLWITLSLCVTLPFMPFLKLALPIPLGLVIFSSFIDPQPRRRLPLICGLYHLIAFASFFYILRLDDYKEAFAYRLLWLLLGFTAHAVVKKIHAPEDLYRILRALGLGFALSILAIIPSLFLGLAEPHIHYKGGRFRPWGTHPNSIGFVFFIAVPFIDILHSFARRNSERLILLSVGGLAVVMGLLTCSRSVIFPLVVLLCVFMRKFMQRPGLLIFVSGVAMIALHLVLIQIDNIQWDRLNTLESRRSVVFQEYWDVICERPLLGVMNSSGESYYLTSQSSDHPHNAFLLILYLFGSSLGGPMLFLFGLTQWAACKSWIRLRIYHSAVADNLLALTVLMIFHGMVTNTLYAPTNHLAFLYLFCSMLYFTVLYSPNKIRPKTPRPSAP